MIIIKYSSLRKHNMYNESITQFKHIYLVIVNLNFNSIYLTFSDKLILECSTGLGKHYILYREYINYNAVLRV